MKPLTTAELSWCRHHPDLVRSLLGPHMKERVVAYENRVYAEPGVDAVEVAAHFLGKSIEKKMCEKRRELGHVRQDLESGFWDGPSYVSHRASLEASARRLSRELEILLEKAGRLLSDPKSQFLPLGTVVRFRKTSVDDQDHRKKNYPVEGSIGVVTGLARDGEFPVIVSMRRSFRDGWGESCDFDDDPENEDTPVSYHVDPDHLEALGHGTFPDGKECLSYDFIPTHMRADGKTEMFIQADDFFWRLHDYGQPLQGVEALQAFRSMDDAPWITEPTKNFIKAETQGGPKM
jgi:hypothetical protein